MHSLFFFFFLLLHALGWEVSYFDMILFNLGILPPITFIPT